VARWSPREAETFFWCFGLHFGTPGAQNPQGDLLEHVIDTGESPDLVRHYRTRVNINFHCDAADGDIQLLSNHTILHARTDYEDFLEPERKRHLLRLWISLPARTALVTRLRTHRSRLGLAATAAGFSSGTRSAAPPPASAGRRLRIGTGLTLRATRPRTLPTRAPRPRCLE